MQEGYDSTNINTLWLRNVYENLHNLEEMERLSREGVSNLVDYANMPERERERMVSLLQYKNLKMMISEMYLLLTDLVPVVDQKFHKGKKEFLKSISEKINKQNIFIHAPVDQKLKRIIKISLKPLFFETLTVIADLREDIIQELSKLLFVKKDEDEY